MKFIEAFINSTITENLLRHLEVENKFNILKNYYKDFENDFYNHFRLQVFELTKLILVNKYHELKENDALVGTTRSERFLYFQDIISQKDFCCTILQEYPVFKKILKKQVFDLLNNHIEIFNNFEKDKTKLSSIFPIISGGIKRIVLEMGDKHNGKTVAKVIFRDGVLYYKPKSLVTDKLFNECLQFLEDKNVCDFKKIKTIDCEDYSWQEEISNLPCKSFNEVERYYYRSGVLLSLMYSIGSCDMHLENIIACGEYPVVIDSETFTSAKLINFKDFDDMKGLESSVLNTAMLPFHNELYDINMSGLFPTKETSNNIYYHSLEEDDKEDILFKKRQAESELQKNTVILNDNIITPDQVEKHLLKGFKDGCNCILENKASLVGILTNSKYNQINIRQILRGTQVYYTFLRESQKPDILKSLSMYDRLFSILYKEFSPSKFGYLRVEEEIKNLKLQNIPYFYTKLNETHLYSNNQIICKNYYDLSPLQNIQNLLNCLTEDMINYQIRLIRLSILTITQTGDSYVGLGKMVQTNERVYNIDNFINSYVSKLMKLQVPNNLDKTATIFIAQIKNEKVRIEEIGPGLYMGGGIIHLLYSYSNYTGDIDSKVLAKRMITGLYKNYSLYVSQKDIPISYGLFEGYGGLIFLAYNYFKLFKDEDMFRVFEEVLESFFEYYTNNQFLETDNDFVNGLGGTLVFLSRLYFDIENRLLKVKIKKFLSVYYNYLKLHLLTEVGVAHGISGICISLSFIFKITKEKEVKDLLFYLLRKEEDIIQEEYQCDNIQYSWCRGISGILLARVIIWENIKSNKKDAFYLEDLINRHLNKQNLDNMFSLRNPCLCHGIFGNIDVLKYVSDNLDLDLTDYINKNYFTEENLQTVEWFEGTDYQFESFMLGLSGSVYGLFHQLQLNFPSITAIDFFSE